MCNKLYFYFLKLNEFLELFREKLTKFFFDNPFSDIDIIKRYLIHIKTFIFGPYIPVIALIVCLLYVSGELRESHRFFF